MLTVTQIFLLIDCLSAAAAVSTDDGGVTALSRDFFDIRPLFEQPRFISLSLHTARKLDHHNGSIERAQGYCYEPGYSCNGATCCDNGSCAGNGQICCGDGICGTDSGCCDNGSCAGNGQICCGDGICDAGYGCCENLGCVPNADTCCANGSHCPPGQGCFSNNNSNEIFCSPTGGGTEPATSTLTYESTPSSLNEPTSVVPALSSVYYYTYEYDWTTFYYISEIESFTTYIVTTVLSVVATDAAAASSSFNAITATFLPTAQLTSLLGVSTLSPSPTTSTVASSTSSASRSTRSGSVASNSGAGPSANITRETLSVMYIVGTVMTIIITI